jgi:hypothetical protein
MYKIKIHYTGKFYPYDVSLFNKSSTFYATNSFTSDETILMKQIINNKNIALLNMRNPYTVIKKLCEFVLKGNQIEIEETNEILLS